MLSWRAANMVGYLILPGGREVEVRDGLVLGRIHSADVVVDDSKASRRHAVLHLAGTVAEIEDLGSSNGTLLNGKKVQRRTLRDGDRIQIGAWAIAYREGAASAKAEPAEAGAELTFDDEDAAPRAPAPSVPPLAHAAPPRAAAQNVAAAAAPPRRQEPAETVEFLDEVVQVRTPPPAAAPARRTSAAPPTASGGRDRGVLQFHKRSDRRGVLAEDMNQMGSFKRALLWLLAFAAALAMGYLAMQLAG